MKKVHWLVIVLIVALLVSACSPGGAADQPKTDLPVFKIGAIPDYNAADLTRSFDSFADFLSDKLGFQVEYVPTVDYATLVTAFERGEIHMAWFGGLTGVQARSLVPEAEAIAQRPADEKFQTVFIKHHSVEGSSLADSVGQSFSFGSESSTSGHLMPRYFLSEAGINPEEDFDGPPNYSGSHDKTYKLVESGAYQMGAVNFQYWDKAVAEGTVDTELVQEFYRTPEYYDYNFTVGPLDKVYGEGTKAKLTDILLTMTPEDSEVMTLLSADKFIATNNANYDKIAEVARQLGLIK